MLSRMKTTVDIPDELFVAAKKRAAELRQPLRELIERGLRAELRRAATTAQAETRQADVGDSRRRAAARRGYR
jgi:hypothetical protein